MVRSRSSSSKGCKNEGKLMNKKICPDCGFHNNPNAKICYVCTTKLEV